MAADKSLAKTFMFADLLPYTRTKDSKVQYLGILLLFLDMIVLGLLNSFSFPVSAKRKGIYTEQALFIEQILINLEFSQNDTLNHFFYALGCVN